MLGNKGTGKNYRDGGCRGGADQFTWESVKSDAYRENYLGHSVSAPVGKWQMGKDILWYKKKMGANEVGQNSNIENRDEVRRREIAAIKALEDDLLNEGLGLAPKRRRTGKVRRAAAAAPAAATAASSAARLRLRPTRTGPPPTTHRSPLAARSPAGAGRHGDGAAPRAGAERARPERR